jgi:hypothetical protein
MIGEALTTQRSAAPEVMFEIRSAHLHGRYAMRSQSVEKLPAREAESGRIDAVVSPVPGAWKVGDRHQFNGGDPQIGEVRQSRTLRLKA